MKKFLGILCLFSLLFVFVACKDGDQKKVDEVYDWLELPGLTDSLTNDSPRIIMPKEKDGVTITWEIDKPEYIDENGNISQPPHEVGDQEVKLTATLTLNKVTRTKEFKGKVLALPPLSETEPLLAEDFKAYADGNIEGQQNLWNVVSGKAGSSIFTVVSSIEGVEIPEGSKALKVEAFTERTLEASIKHDYDFVVIEVDLMQTVSSDATSIHLQSGSSSPVVAFGLNGRNLYYRVDNGEQPGIPVELNKWYRARFEVDLANKTIELFYYEEGTGQLIAITPGKVEFQGSTNLQSFYIRTGSSTTTELRAPAYITNITINRPEALPRPEEKVKLGEITGIEDVSIKEGTEFIPATPKVFNYYADKRELVEGTDYTLEVINEVDTSVSGEYEVTYKFTNKTDASDVIEVEQEVVVYAEGEPNEIVSVESTLSIHPDWLTNVTVKLVQPAGTLYYFLSTNETETAETVKTGSQVEVTSEIVVIEDLAIDDNTYIHILVVLNGETEVHSHELNRKPVQLISTPEEFYQAVHSTKSDQQNYYYLLNADLDFTGFVWEEFVEKFYGIIDGNGHLISNLTMNVPKGIYGGIFEELDGATIKNIVFENINIISEGERSGVISGRTSGSKVTVTNITIINSKVIVGDSTTLGSDMHGALIIGRVNGETEISNLKVVASEVMVYGKYVGGLVSYAEAKLDMSDLDVEIKVTEDSSNPQLVGGIVGRVGSSGVLTLNRVIAKVDLTGSKNIGGLLGKNDGTAYVYDALVTGKLLATSSSDSGAISGNKAFNEAVNVWAVALDGEGDGKNKQSAPAENTLTSLEDVSVSSWWTTNMPNIADSDLWDTAGFASLIREEIVKYTITFVVEDFVVDPIEVRANQQAVLPVPKKLGFEFKGWFLDEAFETPFDSETLIIEDLTLYGYFEEVEIPLYTVSFETDGGSVVEAQNVFEGEKATEPAVPTKEGFAFAGWFTDAGFENEFDFDTPITADITLYAKWNPLVKVMIEANGGIVKLGGNEITYLYLNPGEVLPELVCERKFYNFDGWFTDLNLTVPFELDTQITEEITLYAAWSEAEATEINTVEDFVAFLNDPKEKRYVLTGDIDMTDQTYTPKSFAGILDGQGYTISNLTYSGGDRAGLFTYLRGVVKNIVFENASITSSGRAGLIAGEIDRTGVVIENIVINGLEVTGNNGNGVGGIVAVIKAGEGGATFSNIRIDNATVINTGNKNAGIIVAYSRGIGATIINDIHLSNIYVKATEHVGAVVGYVKESVAFALNRVVLENVKVEGSQYVAALVGRTESGYLDGKVSDVIIKDLIIDSTKYWNVVTGRYADLELTSVFGGNFTLPGIPGDGQTVPEDNVIIDFETLDLTWFEENLPALTEGLWIIVDGMPVLTVFPAM
ncbi:MAG TPA: hypothetical protein GX692_03615 [Acholeplasmataceae bacterium]|nr:hypothetical protein [Acholeplasmataceae bacterium]